MPSLPTLLLTRPQAQAERFAAAARERLGSDLPVVIAPLIAIVPRPLPLPVDGYSGLIFTSENGVAAFAGQSRLRDVPLWCVGARTAQAARGAGFGDVRSAAEAGGDAEALLREIGAAAPEGPLLHLRGAHARGELAPRLRALGLTCSEAVIYDQTALPLPEQARRVLAGAGPVLVPLFSPRSADLLVAELKKARIRAPLHVVAISPAAAERWAAGGHGRAAMVAARPDGRAMLDALERLVAAQAP